MIIIIDITNIITIVIIINIIVVINLFCFRGDRSYNGVFNTWSACPDFSQVWGVRSEDRAPGSGVVGGGSVMEESY